MHVMGQKKFMFQSIYIPSSNTSNKTVEEGYLVGLELHGILFLVYAYSCLCFQAKALI